MNKLIIPLAGIIAALIPLQQAVATVIVTRWTGTLSGGTDYPNLFGLGYNQSLNGLAFTAVYTTDDTIVGGTISRDVYSSGISSGGGLNRVWAKSTTAVLTINGHSFSFSGPSVDYADFDVINRLPVFAADGSGIDYVQNWVESSYGGPQGRGFLINNFVQSKTVDFLHSPDYRAPFSVTPAAGIAFSGGFAIDGGAVGSFSNFVTTGVTTTVGGVPEPASWALLLTGFGVVGAAARRRRVVVTV